MMYIGVYGRQLLRHTTKTAKQECAEPLKSKPFACKSSKQVGFQMARSDHNWPAPMPTKKSMPNEKTYFIFPFLRRLSKTNN